MEGGNVLHRVNREGELSGRGKVRGTPDLSPRTVNSKRLERTVEKLTGE